MKCPDCGTHARDTARASCPNCRASLTAMPDGSVGVLGRYRIFTNRRGVFANGHHPDVKFALLERKRRLDEARA